MWWRQFKKEWLGYKGETALLVGAFVVWTAFLYSRAGVWPSQVIFTLYFLPSGFLPLWAIWTSVQLYRYEWRENTSYLMLSLPVRAWVITSAKLALLLTGIVGYTLLIGAGAVIIGYRVAGGSLMLMGDPFSIVPFWWAVRMILLGYTAMVGGLMVTGLIAQFAYVFSRLFSRFQGLVMGWTWFVTIWLLSRVGDLGGRLLAWMPDFHLPVWEVSGSMPGFRSITIESGPFWALALGVVGVYALLNLILERAIEV